MHISIQQVDVYVPIYKKRALLDSFFILCCGERGIRTPGTSQFNGFQDRRNRPLCHLSSSQLTCKKKLALRVWLAAVAPLNSGSQYTPKIKILGDPVSPSLYFLEVIFSNRLQKYGFFLNCANFYALFLRISIFYSNFAPKIVQKCCYKY